MQGGFLFKLIKEVYMSIGLKTDRATGSAAVAYALTFTDEAMVNEIRFHMSAAAGAETLTVSIDASAGAAYDAVLGTQAMNGLTDYRLAPDVPIHFVSGDVLKVTFANSGNRTWGIETIFQ
jgi:hypothetical protein